MTHVLGVGSFDRPPMRLSRRSDVHTRSHMKLGSVPSSGLCAHVSSVGAHLPTSALVLRIAVKCRHCKVLVLT